MELDLFTEISTTEHFLLNSMSPTQRAELLFCILYVAGGPVKIKGLMPIFDIQSMLEIVQVQVLVQTLNEDLENRSAPYFVSWEGVGNAEFSTLDLRLKSEMIDQLTFSDYFIKQKKLKPEELKLLAFIAYRNHLARIPVSTDELIELLIKFGFERDKATKILFDLQENGLIYYKKERGTDIAKIKLSGDFFDIMGLPKEEFALGSAIKSEMMKLIEGKI